MDEGIRYLRIGNREYEYARYAKRLFSNKKSELVCLFEIVGVSDGLIILRERGI